MSLSMVEEKFCLLEIFFLLTHCRGLTPYFGAVTVQQGEKAILEFNFTKDITPLRYNFLIQRYDFNNKFKDTVLNCFWLKEQLQCQMPEGFSMNENVTSWLHLKINQTKMLDAGIYNCSVVLDGNEEEVYSLSVTVQDAFTTTWVISEGLTEDASEITTNSSFSYKDVCGNREQSYEHAIPIILGVIVFLAIILVTFLLYFIKRHPEEFHQCKCWHTEKKKETDESLETKTELIYKDTKTETMDILEKVNNNDINLQEHDKCLRVIIETKPRSEEQHQFSHENNRTET